MPTTYPLGTILITTPLSIQTRPPKDKTGREEGLRGQKGGDIYLMVREPDFRATGPIFITTGGKGQPHVKAFRVKHGTSYAVWNGHYEAKAGVVWNHPLIVRALISYTRDAILSGHLKDAKVAWHSLEDLLDVYHGNQRHWLETVC